MSKKIYLLISFFFIEGVIHNLGHPVTPALVRGMNISDYMFGVFFAMMSLGMMIGAPIWGIIGDRGKKKTAILIGLGVYSVGQFFFAYSGNAVLMVIFRFISGLGVAAPLTLLTSEMIESSEKTIRTRNLAYIGASTTLGTAIGYWLGGFISTNNTFKSFLGTADLRVVFLIQALLNLFYVFFILMTFKDVQRTKSLTSNPSIFTSLKSITKIDSSLLLFFLSLFFITLGNTNLNKYIDVYFDGLGYNPQQLGTFVMVTGFVSLATSIFLVPLFAKAKKQLTLISLIQILSACIVFFVFRANQFILFVYTIYMIYIVFKTIYQPLEQNYISMHASEGKFGSIMGLRHSFVSLGMFVGPLIGGLLYAIKPLWLFDFSAITFLIGVGLLGVVFILQKKKNFQKEDPLN